MSDFCSFFSMIIFFMSLMFFLRAKSSYACMTILVGKKASATGEVLVGHNEDAPGRFTMQTHIVGKMCRNPNAKTKFEPNLSEIDLFNTRTNLFWSEAKTFSEDYSDSAFCDFYINGNGVVICSNNCEKSKEDNPELLNGGIGYGLRRLVAEKAHTAKDAVEIACNLVEKYGYASSGRSYAFSDKDEIFVMQIVNGKHYAISRVPDDEVAVIPNHYTIREPDKKSRGYDELVSYAIKRGWFNPDEGEIFDFSRVYQADDYFGLEKNTYRHVKAFEILLEMDLSGLLKTEWQSLPFSIKPAQKVGIETLKRILRSHNETPNDHFSKPISICNIDTLESTIVQIRYNPDRIIIRKALGRPCSTPYLTWYFGINSMPEGYEDVEPEKSLDEHFKTKPQDMDYKNNAWYRAMKINAACDILGERENNLVSRKIKSIEENFESTLEPLDAQIELRLKDRPIIARSMMEGMVMQFAERIENFTQEMINKLNIIHGEALNSIKDGENFKVKIPKDHINFNELDISKCKCGTSYTTQNQWSQCINIDENNRNYFELEFNSGEWIKDAVPCFTDLYLVLVDKSGKKFAGTVKTQVRR